jgi:hypothetical protein
MISKFVETLLNYLKTKSYWPLLEPVFTLLSLYVVSCVIAYQYIEWRYHFTPELGTFLRSYLVKQISVVFLTFALLALVLGRSWKAGVRTELGSRLGGWFRSGTRKLVVAGIIVVFATGLFLRLAPHRVSHIKIKFLDRPKSFSEYPFAYIVYELNRSQTDWHFTLDPDTFNRDSRTSSEIEQCGKDPLCYAKLIAEDQPLIGITESGFDQDSFWMNSGSVSVISAGQWKDFEPPSTYEYLSYSLIVQSTIIHLNRNCGGLPRGAFQQSRISYGDLFEFTPRRNEMKAAILAAHLSPAGQELLANCFGLEYMNTCNRLLSLDWLHSGRVHDNLEKNFGTKL